MKQLQRCPRRDVPVSYRPFGGDDIDTSRSSSIFPPPPPPPPQLSESNETGFRTSVLSVTYDGENTERLDAYFSSLAAQIRPADEIVLVLDGDIREELEEIISRWRRSLPLKLVRSEKQGLGPCLNIGLGQCTGKIIFRADTDDINFPERFSEQLLLFEDSRISVVSASVLELMEDGKRFIKSVPSGFVGYWNLCSFFRNPVNHNCCAFRADVVREVGGYPAARIATGIEDYILWIRLMIHSKKIFGSKKILLRADATQLVARRGGKGYLLAELFLMRENARRLMCFGSVLALVAFFMRVPFRFSAMEWLRAIVYRQLLRRKVG